MITLLLVLIGSIPTPSGYTRVKTDDFGTHIRNYRLKEDKTVYLYDGRKKANQNAQYAVLDIPVGIEDLQQCADAVMRIRAEYLYSKKKPIVFWDNNNKPFQFGGFNSGHLEKYLEVVFARCNSASLEKQMVPKNIRDMRIGDVLIKGGFPGHVVIVVDMAVNDKGEKIYMLAQSYMPAQDIHILNGENGPWYKIKDGVIDTPEYTFYSNQLRGW
jgi:hypothetical protein